MYWFPLELTFFGLTPQYRTNLWTQIHDLVYHGGGGFIHSEVYNMPIWLRKFHISKINEWNRQQKEEMDKAKAKNKTNLNKIQGPNIPPSSTYKV